MLLQEAGRETGSYKSILSLCQFLGSCRLGNRGPGISWFLLSVPSLTIDCGCRGRVGLLI